MLEIVKELGLETAKVYALLISLYFGVGAVLVRTNARRPRIQDRPCPSHIVRRDILQSTKSLASISFFFALGSVMSRHGIGWRPPTGAWGAAGSLLASMLMFDTLFYWGHRLIHTRLLFKHVHKWHHVSRTPTVWSNNSDSLIDNCVLQSYWIFAHLVLPIHPAVLLVHKVFDQVSGMVGHTGHEYTSGRTEVSPYPMLAVTFHDQHHAYFNCNFATHFSIWDRSMRTLHPDYESTLKKVLGRPRDTAAVRTGDSAHST